MAKCILKNNKGVSLVLIALSIVVLLGFAALAIDVGHLYNVKNELQAAADFAAIAGAKRLIGDGTLQTTAREEAQRIAARNYADVAGAPVPAYEESPGANPGQRIPIALQPNVDNAADGDIVVGHWSGKAFFPAPPGGFINASSINAIKVVARRTGLIGAQPRVNNWFAKVLALLPGNPNYSLANVASTAIAAKTPLPILPIAVNEYWDEATDHDGNPANNSGTAYGQAIQHYPVSFMREINADDTISQLGGKTFAILGIDANCNNASFNLNSFVDILHRNRLHTPVVTSPLLSDYGDERGWYEVVQNSTTGSCSPNCGSNLRPIDGLEASTGISPKGVKNGDVDPGKFDTNFRYLFGGIPNNIIPPNAVREIIRTDEPYSASNYNNTTTFNDPSNCPFASIPYFAGSGATAVIKKLNVEDDVNYGRSFWEVYPQGSKFIVMVYDGTLVTNPDPNQANVVTVVGYGVIEVDGYSNSPYNDGDPLHDGGIGGSGGGTVYGHALPHNLTAGDVNTSVVDVSDKYIIQPPKEPTSTTPSSARKGSCGFTNAIRQLQNSYASVHLVDPSLHYGIHQQ